MENIYLLLDKKRAIEVLHEVSRPERSNDPVARAIIDADFKGAQVAFGNVSIVYEKPQDSRQERILRVEADPPGRAINNLVHVRGVKNAGRDKYHL